MIISSCMKQSVDEKYFNLIKDEFSGEKAKATVAFVEKDWRVVGNTMFNASIFHVENKLKIYGYINEDNAKSEDRLTYRIEKRPLNRPTWEIKNASLKITGDEKPLLEHSSNRNMVVLNSFSTAPEGIEAEVIDLGSGSEADFKGKNVKGKIVFAESSVSRLFGEAVQNRGALGVIAYRMPAYLKPELHRNTIQFSGIPYDEDKKSWGILLSTSARDELKSRLEKGKVTVNVMIESSIYDSEELTLIADIKGSISPDERFVYSAHVQEPGANDNASGVGCLTEIARVAAELLDGGDIDPKRTITMIWGDEIRSTRNYIQDDSIRAKGIKWGMSLDMVGEDTKKTGGTFLIEKMPDPSAIWTRGDDKHSEWGGDVLSESDMRPHYYNDFIVNRFLKIGKTYNWVVKTNPFEGGSDHTPFLRANIPGLLLWHFTDEFYHTDGDRLENVSAETLRNVGTGALISALILSSANETTALWIIEELKNSALQRLGKEIALSKTEIANGKNKDDQIQIIQSWTNWYEAALNSCNNISIEGNSNQVNTAISNAINELTQYSQNAIKSF
ncbi:MAG: M28 family peptidase [Calditrichaeota bacterium]|nr:M28 family peptidase [Calditrichota bacterium]